MLTNVFVLNDITSIKWKRYVGQLDQLAECQHALLNANIPTACTYLENAFNLPTPPQQYGSLLDGINFEIGPFDKMHLYILRWGEGDESEDIINNFDSIEFAESGQWDVQCEYRANNALYQMDEDPEGEKKRQQWILMKKIIFKSLDNHFQTNLCKNSFIRIGDYNIFPSTRSVNNFSQSNFGEIGFTIHFFINEGTNPRICFTINLCRTIFKHLDDVDGLNDPNTSNFLVITAPNSIIGVLKETDAKDGSSTNNDTILKQWEKYHYIKDTSVISVLIGSRIQKFPRRCVFKLIPSMYINENSNLPYTALGDSLYSNPNQYYENIYKHIFGSTHSMSICKEQPSTLFNKSMNLSEITMLTLIGKIPPQKKQHQTLPEIIEIHEEPQRSKKRPHSPMNSPPKAKKFKIIGKPVENKKIEETSIMTPKSEISELKDDSDVFGDENLEQWLEFVDEVKDPMGLYTPGSHTDISMINGEKKRNSTDQLTNKIVATHLRKTSLLGKVEYESWVCPTHYKALHITNKEPNLRLNYQPLSNGSSKEKNVKKNLLPSQNKYLHGSINGEESVDWANSDSESDDEDDLQTYEYFDHKSENSVSFSRETSTIASNSTMVQQLVENTFFDSAKSSLALQTINFLDSGSNVFIPNFASIQHNNNVWLHNEIIFSMNPSSPISPSILDKSNTTKDSLFEIIKQEALNCFSTSTSYGESTLTYNPEINKIKGLEYWRLLHKKYSQKHMSDNDSIYTLAYWTSIMSIYGHEVSIEDWLKKNNANISSIDLDYKISTWGGSLESMYFTSWPNRSDISYVDWDYALKVSISQSLKSLFNGSLQGPLSASDFLNLNQNITTGNNEKSKIHLETFTQPNAIVGYDRKGMEISTNALYLWEKLDLQPYSLPKDIRYFVISPDFFISPDKECVKFYFEQLSSMYHLCNLGSHKQHESIKNIASVNQPGLSREKLLSSSGLSSSNLLNAINRADKSLDELHKNNIYKLTDDIKNSYKEACLNVCKAIQGFSTSFDISIVIYIINPYIQDDISLSSSVDTGFMDSTSSTGLSSSQQIESQISYTHLMQFCSTCLKPLSENGIILHGVQLSRVLSSLTSPFYFKETAFNVFNKCRRVSSHGPKSKFQTKLYEPLFIVSSSLPRPVEDVHAFFQENKLMYSAESDPEEDEKIKQRDENVLHIAYSLANGFMNICCADSHGELLETVIEPAAFQSKELSVVLNQIYSTATRIVQSSMTEVGKIVLGKFGILTVEEVKEWKHIIDDAISSKQADSLKQITLVSLTLSSEIKLSPQEYKNQMTIEHDQKGKNQHRVNLEHLYSDSLLKEDRTKTVALYNMDENMIDEKGIPIIAKSHIFNSVPGLSKSNLNRVNQTAAIKINMYLKGSIESDENSSGLIKDISRQYHQLSWLNISPNNPQRTDILPIHFRLVRRLAAMSYLICK